MTALDQTIQAFGRSIGIEPLQFNDQGVVHFILESQLELFIEQHETPTETIILLSGVRPLSFPSTATYQGALLACHHRRHHPFPVNAGLTSDEKVVFMIRFLAEELSLPNLEAGLDLLIQLHSGADLEAS